MQQALPHRQQRRRLRVNQQHDEQVAPSDTCNIIEIIFLSLGTGYMLSYNVLITPIDYYDAIYIHYKSSIMYYIVPIHRAFLLLSLLLMVTPCFTHYHRYDKQQITNRVSWHLLITIPFFIIFICLSIYPYFPQYIHKNDESMYFMILLITCSFCGFFGGIIQCAVTSFCNYLPSQYMKASISGQAMAGIIICLIKILTKIINQSDYMLTGKIYFVTGGIINVICALLFIGTKNTKLVKFYLNGRNKLNQDYLSRYDSIKFHSEKTVKLIEQHKRKKMQNIQKNNDVVNMNQRTHLLSNDSEAQEYRANVNYCSVFQEIMHLAIGTFIVMTATFLYFPGLMLSIKSQYKIFENSDDWFGILLITEYNIFDYIGRQFLSKYMFCIHSKNIMMFSIIRGVLIYVCFYILYKQYIVSDILLHIVNIMGALSNGYLICLMFIFLSDSSRKDRNYKTTFNHISATIMTLSLNLGILFGSICAIFLQTYVL
eukprot:512588_1